MIRWLLAGLLLASGACWAMPPRHPLLMTYYESWLETPATPPLAGLPPMLDIVALAFAKPDGRYDGGLDLSQTGLTFSRPGAAVRADVLRLRRANPAIRVLLAVGAIGGAGWDRLDAAALARLVRDLGLDGIDADFEPADPGCHAMADRIHCASDARWSTILGQLRAALPRGAMLSVPGWSVGAFGVGPWAAARPPSPWTGSMLNPLRLPPPLAPDLVSVMAYDAGPDFQPEEALAAYRAHWPGPLLGGVEVTSGATPVPGPDGLMIYGWLSRPPPGHPDAAAIALAACGRWRSNCR